jgi:hypothetical protein
VRTVYSRDVSLVFPATWKIVSIVSPIAAAAAFDGIREALSARISRIRGMMEAIRSGSCRPVAACYRATRIALMAVKRGLLDDARWRFHSRLGDHSFELNNNRWQD